MVLLDDSSNAHATLGDRSAAPAYYVGDHGRARLTESQGKLVGVVVAVMARYSAGIAAVLAGSRPRASLRSVWSHSSVQAREVLENAPAFLQPPGASVGSATRTADPSARRLEAAALSPSSPGSDGADPTRPSRGKCNAALTMTVGGNRSTRISSENSISLFNRREPGSWVTLVGTKTGRPMRGRWAWVLLALTLAAGMAACGASPGNLVPVSSPGSVTPSAAAGSVSARTAARSGRAAFPLPNYQPSKVVIETSGGLELNSIDSVSKVTSFYMNALKSRHWRIIYISKSAANTNIAAMRGTTGLSISISRAGPAGTSVIVTTCLC
jgi:hypothetical protein